MRNMLHRSSSFENFNSRYIQLITGFDHRMNDRDSIMKAPNQLPFSQEK